MKPTFHLWPEQASTVAPRVDALFWFLCALSIVVCLIIVGALLWFSVRYRRKTVDRGPMRGQVIDHGDTRRLEIAWIVVPMFIFVGIFYWGAKVYAHMAEPPPDALTVYVVGKRWMWKTQHLGGQREINELHVPVGQAVKLIMTSEDVIHSFYVPAFRVKADVLPGRYTTLWFEPTKVGSYHLFCAEYCGTKHSQMIGKVVVMEPAAYQSWLGGGQSGSLADAGAKRFNDLGCNTCHKEEGETGARAPRLRGLFGSTVKLQGGEAIVADENYLRQSIMDPRAKLVAGYEPIMPTYATQLGEDGVIELIAYIRSMGAGAGATSAAGDGAQPDGGAPAAVAGDAGAPEATQSPTAGDAGAPAQQPSAAPGAPPSKPNVDAGAEGGPR
ncbi:MAG: cytochrome c oxidase subunit II [Polyangiaceae bacterium]